MTTITVLFFDRAREADTALKPGDELAVVPPISGG
jgi:molybdopterin converting factor small subunit